MYNPMMNFPMGYGFGGGIADLFSGTNMMFNFGGYGMGCGCGYGYGMNSSIFGYTMASTMMNVGGTIAASWIGQAADRKAAKAQEKSTEDQLIEQLKILGLADKTVDEITEDDIEKCGPKGGYQEKVDAAQTKVNDVQKKIDEQNTVIEAQESTIKTKEGELETAKTTLKTLEDALSKLEGDDKKAKEEEIKKAKENISNIETAIKNAKTAKQEAEKEKAKAEKEKEKAEKELKEAKSALAKAEDDVSAAKGAAKRLLRKYNKEIADAKLREEEEILDRADGCALNRVDSDCFKKYSFTNDGKLQIRQTKIPERNEDGTLYTTKAQRTGCDGKCHIRHYSVVRENSDSEHPPTAD